MSPRDTTRAALASALPRRVRIGSTRAAARPEPRPPAPPQELQYRQHHHRPALSCAASRTYRFKIPCNDAIAARASRARPPPTRCPPVQPSASNSQRRGSQRRANRQFGQSRRHREREDAVKAQARRQSQPREARQQGCHDALRRNGVGHYIVNMLFTRSGLRSSTSRLHGESPASRLSAGKLVHQEIDQFAPASRKGGSRHVPRWAPPSHRIVVRRERCPATVIHSGLNT